MIGDWEQLVSSVEQLQQSAEIQLSSTTFVATRVLIVRGGLRLAIRGNEARLVRCQHNNPYFYVEPNASLLIDGLASIANCKHSSSGGVVFNAGSFIAKNSNFVNNTVRVQDKKCPDGCKSAGGAIYSIAGTVKLFNCTFEGNGVSHVTSKHHQRQMIDASGGAIALYNTSAGLKNCRFVSNTVNVTDLTSRSQRVYVTQKAQGGAVFSTNSLLEKMEDCHFRSNSALSKGPFPLSFGGAVSSFQDFGGATQVNTSFQSNQVVASPTQPEEGFAQAQGGGYFRYCSVSTPSSLPPTNSYFASSSLSFTNNSYFSNEASLGGGVYLQNCNASMLGQSFANNKAHASGVDIYTSQAVELRLACLQGNYGEALTLTGESTGHAVLQANLYTGGEALTASSLCSLFGEEPFKHDFCAQASQSHTLAPRGCHPCPAGQFNPYHNKSSCQMCPLGRYSTTVGAISDVDCISCPMGQFWLPSNHTLRLHSHELRSTTGCQPCSAGKYSSSLNATSCVDCSVGRYNPENGSVSSSSCLLCPPGLAAVSNSSFSGCINLVAPDTPQSDEFHRYTVPAFVVAGCLFAGLIYIMIATCETRRKLKLVKARGKFAKPKWAIRVVGVHGSMEVSSSMAAALDSEQAIVKHYIDEMQQDSVSKQLKRSNVSRSSSESGALGGDHSDGSREDDLVLRSASEKLEKGVISEAEHASLVAAHVKIRNDSIYSAPAKPAPDSPSAFRNFSPRHGIVNVKAGIATNMRRKHNSDGRIGALSTSASADNFEHGYLQLNRLSEETGLKCSRHPYETILLGDRQQRPRLVRVRSRAFSRMADRHARTRAQTEMETLNFADCLGCTLRIVPQNTRRTPLALRGIKVAQLRQFDMDYAGDNSRVKQKLMMQDCPPGKSYVEWKLGAGNAQLPVAIISYSWRMTWRIMIDFLQKNIGSEGTVWIDLLACDQHAIEDGDMSEIRRLPKVIEFIGQTFVMPGTLARLWCIFEMAYSLLFDARLIYYDERCAEEDEAVRTLQQADASQLLMTSESLLAHAECYKKTDKAFIMSMFERNFEDSNEMVETIKTVIRRRMHAGLLHNANPSGNATDSSSRQHMRFTKWSLRRRQEQKEKRNQGKPMIKMELAAVHGGRRSSGAPTDSRELIRQISRDKAKRETGDPDAYSLDTSQKSTDSDSKQNDGFHVSPLHNDAEELTIDITAAPSTRDFSSSGNNSGLSVEEF